LLSTHIVTVNFKHFELTEHLSLVAQYIPVVTHEL